MSDLEARIAAFREKWVLPGGPEYPEHPARRFKFVIGKDGHTDSAVCAFKAELFWLRKNPPTKESPIDVFTWKKAIDTILRCLGEGK